jgi:NAD(P)-dependent dehydrogenase (short-subunit alcohol dehydrogenase family)
MDDRVALVTGAGSGIGRATALRFAREGMRVGVLSHTPDEVEKVVAEIRGQGGDALDLTADVSNSGEVKGAVDRLVSSYGRLDIVFANAGVNGVWAPIDEIQPEEWDHTVATNLRGTYLTIHHATPHLKAAGRGSIVITSSVNGTRIFSNAGATAYACTKAAQVALAQMLAVELAKHHIRVNVICPGRIETAIQGKTERRNIEEAREPVEYPEGKIPLTDGEGGSTEEVAELVHFLCSDSARFISGTPVWIDGAQSVLVG